MRMDAIIRLAEDCREQRKPPRCAECDHHGQPDCAWSIEVTPDRKPPSPVRREETIEERVGRLFADIDEWQARRPNSSSSRLAGARRGGG